jgi:tetratricopeptide (TPR) repeat protein
VVIDRKGASFEKVGKVFQISSISFVPKVSCEAFTRESKVAIRYDLPVEKRDIFIIPEHAELWFTSDDGGRWQRGSRKSYKKGSFNFSFEDPLVESGKEMEYGFYVVIYGRGKALNPLPINGETLPLTKTVFDRKKPQVIIEKMKGYYYSPEGKVRIRFAVKENYLDETPLSIYYSSNGGRDKWHVVQTNVPDNVEYVWAVPQDITAEDISFKIRVVARDRAGNRGEGESTSFFVIRSLPTVSVTGPAFTSISPAEIHFAIQGNTSIIGINKVVFYHRESGTEGKWKKLGTGGINTSPEPFDLPEGVYDLYAVLDTEFSMSEEQRRVQNPVEVLRPAASEKAQFVVTVDYTKPVVKLVYFGKAEMLFKEKASVPISWVVEDKYFDHLSIRIERQGGGKTASYLIEEKLTESEGGMNIILAPPTGDGYLVRIIAYDKAENEGSDRSRVFSIDGDPPIIRLKRGASGRREVNIPYDLSYQGAEPLRIDVYYRLKPEDKPVAWMPYTSLSGDDLKRRSFVFQESDGEYEIYAVAYDELRNHNPLPVDNEKAPPGTLDVLLTKKVEVSLLGFETRSPYRAGREYTVKWICREETLAPMPVTFKIRRNDDDKWRDIGGLVPNTGRARLRLPGDWNSKFCLLKIIVTNKYKQTGEDVLGHYFEIRSIPPEPAEILSVSPAAVVRGVPRKDYRAPRDKDLGTKPRKDWPERPDIERGDAPAPPEPPETGLIEKADALFDRELYHDAVAHYNRALRQGEDAARAHYGLARCYLQLGASRKDVLSRFKSALMHKRNWSPCLNDLGVVYFQSGDFEIASKYFEKAVKYKPDSAVYLTNYGAALYNMGDYVHAREALDKALALDQNNRDAYWYLAKTFTAQREWAKARNYWQKAQRYFEEDPYFGPKLRENLMRVIEELAAQRRREE